MHSIKITVIILFSIAFYSAKAQVKEFELIEQELITTKDDTARARLLNDAAFLLRNSNPQQSLKYASLAMDLSISSSYNKGILNAYLVKGIIYKRLGEFETSMKNYMVALQISELISDTSRISSCYNNIGSIYQAQSNYSKAIAYFQKSLEIEQLLGRKDQVSIRLYNIGTIYESIDKLDSAYNYYNKSFLIEESLENDEGISFALYGLGGVLAKKGEFSKAEILLNKAYELAQINKDVAAMSYCLNELGVLYMKWGKSDLAVSFFKESISYADSLEEKNQIKETYHNLALTYADLGKYQDAFDYFLKFNDLNEEINNSDISRKIAEINTKYEVDKVDREMELLKKEGRIKELEYDQQKNLTNYLIFSSLIVIIIGFLRFSRKKSAEKNRQGKEIEKQKTDASQLFEKILFSKVAWAILLSIYSMIYLFLIQPFGLATLDLYEKSLILPVYGAITLTVVIISFLITSIWNEYFRKHSLILKFLLLALINIVLLSLTLFIYNGLQGLNEFSFSSLTEVITHIIIISLLPIFILVLFYERITYAQNLKDIPLEIVAQQQELKHQIEEVTEEKLITIKTDNVGESIQLSHKQIICFEANDNYTAIYYLFNNKIKKELYRITLKKLENQLFEFKEIIRCHKSYIINITHLERISGNAQGFKMHLKNLDFEIPVSRSFPRQIIDDLKDITLKKS